MEFKHINDCWNYLREAKDYNDLIKRCGDIPNRFGTWDVEPNEYHEARVINSYYDETFQNWDQDIEDFDIKCPYIGNDYGDDYEIILDYDEFKVLKNIYDGKYKLIDEEGYMADEELELCAVLVYDINHDVNDDGMLLSELFDCNYCGEQITDNDIKYYWFKNKEVK